MAPAVSAIHCEHQTLGRCFYPSNPAEKMGTDRSKSLLKAVLPGSHRIILTQGYLTLKTIQVTGQEPWPGRNLLPPWPIEQKGLQGMKVPP